VAQFIQQTNSPVSDFWQEQRYKHPTLYGILSTLWTVISFFLNGHFIVVAGRWLIRVSGYVSETSLLFAVLWITGTSIAPDLIKLVMSETMMQRVLWFALIVLAIIPEIILANAIVNAIGHWITLARHPQSVVAWTWALLFTLPTVLFFILTAITLNTLGAHHGNLVAVSTDTLNWRIDAGWIYGLLEMTHAGVKKFMPQHAQSSSAPVPVLPTMPTSQEVADTLMPLFMAHLSGLRASIVAEITPLVAAPASATEPFDYETLVVQLASRLAPTPVNYQELAHQIVPLLAQEPVAPLDYEEVARTIVPLLKPSFVEVHHSNIEEVKALVPHLAVPAPPLETGNIVDQSSSEETEAEREARLEAAYQALLTEGKRISGRALATRARCNRKAAAAWLEVTYPEMAMTRATSHHQDMEPSLLVPEPGGEAIETVPDGGLDLDQSQDTEPFMLVPEPALEGREMESEPEHGATEVVPSGDLDLDQSQNTEPQTDKHSAYQLVPEQAEDEKGVR